MGFIWNATRVGITHMKKCSPKLGVNQYFPGARSLIFHAMCRLPENEHVVGPHNGSFLVSHRSSSFMTNNRLASNRPAINDMYKNVTFGFFVNANSQIFTNNGWKHM